MNLKPIRLEVTGWMHLAHDRDKEHVMNLSVPQNVKFLTS
jgi:hypothetical protein